MKKRIFFEQLLALPDLKVDKVHRECTRILLYRHGEQDVPRFAIKK